MSETVGNNVMVAYLVHGNDLTVSSARSSALDTKSRALAGLTHTSKSRTV